MIIFNTAGAGNWTVPDTGIYTIECIGGGVGGTLKQFFFPGKGGGAGSYSRNENVALTAGAIVAYEVAAGYTSPNGLNQGAGGDTWVGTNAVSTAYCLAYGANATVGGLANTTWSTIAYKGGDGLATFTDICGGGGAGGPNGAGADAVAAAGGAGDGGLVAANTNGTSMGGGTVGPGGGGNGAFPTGQNGGSYGAGGGGGDVSGVVTLPGIGLIVITFVAHRRRAIRKIYAA